MSTAGSQTARSWLPAMAVAALFLVATALQFGWFSDPAAIRPADIRRYDAPKAPTAASPAPAGRPAVGSVGQLEVEYETPAGWTDRGRSADSSLRLATLAIGDATGQEVTIVNASGTLEANIGRWLGQLDPAADPAAIQERLTSALAAVERVPVGDREATIVFLPAEAATAGEGEAILAAVIPLGEPGAASLFVKFKGPAATARQERDNFRRFVSSLRWK